MIADYRDDELRKSVVIPAIIQQALRKSCQDTSFRNRLVGQPTATLRAEGYELPPGVEVEVLQDTEEVLHLVLPFNTMSSHAELSDAQLTAVVGGGRKSETAKSIYS